MKGSVTKYVVTGSSRPKWRYRIRLGRDENKVYQREGRGGFAKEGDACEAMRIRIDEIRAQRNAPPETPKALTPPDPTLGEWLTRWIENYAVHTCQPKTLERYRQLARYITDATADEISTVAGAPISSLKHVQLEAALRALLKQKAVRHEHISARTVRHVAGVLQVALNEAFRLDLITVNPMLKVKLPSVEQKQAESLTPEQIHALRDSCRGDWTFALIEVALATAARRGELLALQWSDIDWTSGLLTISKSLEQTKAGLRVKKPKNGKQRPCQLPQSALVALRFLRDQQTENRRLFAGEYRDNGLIFCQPNGDNHEPDLISQVIIRRIRKAGIKHGSLHTLRHTHASHLLSNGVSLAAVSARLGHANPNVTARIYLHALPADDQRAADAWDAVVSGPVH